MYPGILKAKEEQLQFELERITWKDAIVNSINYSILRAWGTMNDVVRFKWFAKEEDMFI